MNQTRREFLKKSGWMVLGSLLVPYIPKTFYSIPSLIRADQLVPWGWWSGPKDPYYFTPSTIAKWGSPEKIFEWLSSKTVNIGSPLL